MIWSAMLIAISGYSWFLLFASGAALPYMNLWSCIVLLFFLAIIPVRLAYKINRHILASKPTVVKIMSVNLITCILYICIFALGNFGLNNYRQPIITFWGFYVSAGLLQLLSWGCGIYFCFDNQFYHHPTNIRTAEISLALILPAILTLESIPTSIILLMVLCWFTALILSLTIEGKEITSNSAIHYDLIFFNALIPLIAAGVLTAAIFLNNFNQLLHSVKIVIIKIFWLAASYINNLFTVPEEEYLPANVPSIMPPLQKAGLTIGLPPLLRIFIILLLLIIFLFAVKLLIHYIKHCLNSIPEADTVPRKLSFNILRQILQILSLLTQDLYKVLCAAVRFITSGSARIWAKIVEKIRSKLPAKTPGQQIFRSYQAFLHWGQKKGYPKKNFETPLEYEHRLNFSSGINPCPKEEISELTNLFLEAFYSGKTKSWMQGDKSKMLFEQISKSRRT